MKIKKNFDLKLNLKLQLTVAAMAISTITPQMTWAWGDLGHETVAEIAEQIVAKDAQLKTAIQAVVGVEPFAISATWPDHARSDERFTEFAPYHFVTMFRDPKKVTEKDAMTVMQKYPLMLTNSSFPRESKMIAFRYIVHVVGDLHQPLHVGNEFDRGGNSCQVTWQPDAERKGYSTNLHSAWDTNLVDFIAQKFKKDSPDVKYYGYKQLAKSLMAKHSDIVNSNASIDVSKWVLESDSLRKTSVYPDQLPEDQRPYCQTDKSKKDLYSTPTLDGAYAEQKAQIVEKQIVLAGVRLAAFLKEVFKGAKNRTPVEAKILELLKVSNDVHSESEHH